MRNFFFLLISFWIVTLFLPWWTLFIPAIVLGAALFDRSMIAFFIGFLSLFFAWFLQVLYIDIANESVLSTRISDMMGLGNGFVVLLITGLIGGLIGGVGTLLGAQIRQTLHPQHTS